MPMPSLHVYIIMLQNAWPTTQDSSPPQEGWRTTTWGGRKRCRHDWKKAKENGEKKRITIHWVKGERRWKAADQHSRSLATPRVAGITAGIVILVNENISISSKLQFYNVPYAYCTIISAKDYLCYGNNAWPYWQYVMFWNLSSTATIGRLGYCD